MAELGDILASLKITPKGKLKYDKRWVADDLQVKSLIIAQPSYLQMHMKAFLVSFSRRQSSRFGQEQTIVLT